MEKKNKSGVKNLKASEIINELKNHIDKYGDLVCICGVSKNNIKNNFFINGLSKFEEKFVFTLEKEDKPKKGPDKKPKIKLRDENGNAHNILGETVKALQLAGADEEYIDSYLEEAKSGDYDNLIAVTEKYVDTE